MKKLTSSRKVIEILNRFGHTPGYHVIEELETELTFNATKNAQMTPHGMSLSPNLATGVAFDNFDRFVETLNGKDTLHDTVGIAFQDVVEDSGSCVPVTPRQVSSNRKRISTSIDFDIEGKRCREDTTLENVTEHQKGTTSYRKSLGFKRRRKYEETGTDIEPYRKKPKMISHLVPTSDARWPSPPDSLATAIYKDIIWILALIFDPDGTAMWVGWNSGIAAIDEGKKQQLWYMPQINLSPTSHSVVAETLKRALKIAQEGGRQSIAVTYDLAIAKIAYQIQSSESPLYDKAFIKLGGFHIEIAYFNAVGKYIDESGGPYILTECGVLAPGSLNGFIKGKHYNRCKRLHQLFSAALEILNFEEFINTSDILDTFNSIKHEISSLSSKKLELNVNNFSRELQEILDSYERYCGNIETDGHGCTAKFWHTYINMIKLYHQFSRSIREGDYDLYVYCLPEIAKYFFVFNQPNYARWILQYHSNLLRINETHPEIEAEFRKGRFGIRRTSKPFSRSPVDLTLEQTINADASSQRTGIAAFTNSISARQRWAQSHSISTAILSSLFEDLGLTKKEDVSADLKPNRIRKNLADLRKLKEMCSQTMNPFSSQLNPNNLYNIGSGKAASLPTKDFVLNIVETGKNLRDSFINECSIRSERFEEPIKRQKMSTFAAEGKRVKKKAADGKVIELKMERDLLGKMLCLALSINIDLKEVLTYPLTPVPMTLCHFDGTMRSMQKDKLMEALEKRVKSSEPTFIHCLVIDGNFFLHLLTNVPTTFGKISTYIFRKICHNKASRIDLVFDRIVTPSIKDNERDKRDVDGERGSKFHITGPNQTRPLDFLEALRNDDFKRSLIAFLCDSWENDSLLEFIEDKIVYVTSGEQCFSFRENNGRMCKAEENQLESSHEEADSRMFFHLSSLSPYSSAVVRTNDTDVLIIALRAISQLKLSLWLEVGKFTNNTLRYININELQENLGSRLCSALPAFHAFTGSDYTAAFNRKGKVTPLKKLEEKPALQDAFSSLGNSNGVNEHNIKQTEKFVCEIYNNKKLDSVDDVRYEAFLKAYKPKAKKTLLHIRSLNGMSLCLSFNVLQQKILRTHLVSSIWCNSTSADPPNLLPENFGYQLDNGKYYPRWYTGNSTPPSIESITEQQEQHQNGDSEVDDETDTIKEIIEESRECESDESSSSEDEM